MKNSVNFDAIIIGAGHAGLEAAFACANSGIKTAIFTLSEKNIGVCPCNPSVGGPAKGIVTREIDALGGMQSIAADENQLQMKILNISKGAGVQALRAQIDKIKYSEWFVKKIKENKNLSLVLEEVKEIIVKNKKVVGIKTSVNTYTCKCCIITTGTYMEAITHCGLKKNIIGPTIDYIDHKKLVTFNSKRSTGLSENLKQLGFELIRLKTGTPPRIYKDSIDYSKMQVEPGSRQILSFEYYKPTILPFKKQEKCWLTYTNKNTHKIILDNLLLSAMYSGNIKGTGPRYCPSIEDKCVRFADKERHQIFIEPESLQMDTMYLQGLSTSLPPDVQEKFVHTIVGLENARFQRYAYAIEYDAIKPTQLHSTLEAKKISGLYFAGQINGSSGYEEAAGQGIVAGINASLKIRKMKELILHRDEAYIGVMIDDLVSKGVTDPYRLLTSRAEYRLSLRNDNAEDRLINHGYRVGLISSERYKYYSLQTKKINQLTDYLKKTSLNKQQIKKYGTSYHSLYSLVKRNDITIKKIISSSKFKQYDPNYLNKLEIVIKYEGYINGQEKFVKEYKKLNNISLKKITNYKLVKNLSLEAIDKLNKINPETLWQAQQIQGITFNDIIQIKLFIDKN